MLILLDENLLSRKLKRPLVAAGHRVKNVEDMGWRGVTDRQLLDLAVAASFDVFITADKNLPYQQNLKNLSLRIVVLDATSTRPDHLRPLITQISEQLPSLEIGSVMFINDAGEMTSFEL